MRTDDLITALATDGAVREPGVAAALWRWLAPATLVTAAVLVLWVEIRPDVLASFLVPAFTLKMALVGSLAVAALAILPKLGRPGARVPWGWLGLPAAVAVIALGVDLGTQPVSGILARWIGYNWLACMLLIPVLALAPFVALLWALRSAAPTDPALAGAMAGLTAGAIGAVAYGLHCWDDSALFVLTWYSIAVGALTFLGRWAGRWVLTW